MSILYFKKDLGQASKSNSVLINVKVLLLEHTVHQVFIIRLGQSLSKLPFLGRLVRFFFEYLIRIIYSSDISLNANIGAGLVLSHGHDIVIGADVVLGCNCRIFNGVTLGNRDLTKSSRGSQPKVGEGVVICTGAKVLGPINIGDKVIIGANAVVLNDCEPGSSYVGIPARKIN